MPEIRQAFVGAGANLGDRLATLRAAIDRLRIAPGVVSLMSSSVFETEPVGVTDQPLFLNLVVGIETTLSPEELLYALQEIEQTFGRVRTQRWGPRTLDLDLLAFEGERRDNDTLVLPHPRMLEREFVTIPLREVVFHLPFRSQKHWDELRAKLGSPANTTSVERYATL